MSEPASIPKNCIDIFWCTKCDSLEYFASPSLKDCKIEAGKPFVAFGTAGRLVSYRFEHVMPHATRYVAVPGCDVRWNLDRRFIHFPELTSNIAKLRHICTKTNFMDDVENKTTGVFKKQKIK